MRRPLANTTAIVHRPSRSAVPLPPITLTRTSFLPSLWISPGLVRSRLSPRCNVLSVTPWIRQNSPRDRPLVPNSLTSRWTSCRVRRRRDLTSSGSVIRPLQQIPPRNGRCVSKTRTFQQYGSRCRMWIPPEVKDPVLQHHPTRKSVGYFGAVRLRDGKFIFARELDRFDAMTTWNFLRLLQRRSLNNKRRAIVITDNAKYHHAKLHSAWRQKNEGHFRLDYLPPYSPDLNPIERVWKLTRKLCIHDQYFPSIAAVITAVETQFDKWTSGNATLRRLCSI